MGLRGVILPLFGSPEIQSVQGAGLTTQYQSVEYRVGLTAAYTNPFDPDEVALDAFVLSPSGKRLTVPGFYYRPYRRSVGKATRPIAVSSTAAVAEGKASPTETSADAEILQPCGEGDWRIRFTPTEVGRYRLELTLRTRDGSARRRGIVLRVRKGSGGFVRVSPRDRRYFALDDGRAYWPLGANVAWAGAAGLRDYEKWLPAYGKVGANWGRFWLSPGWTTFALEPTKAGQIDLANAWRLDAALALARQNGVRVSLCIDSYNVLRDRVSWPEWERSPLNQANGGPLAKPADFWTSPAAEKLYRDRLRYLVARWGADPTVMAWEFWNEVDGTADYHVDPVREWHARMSAALRRLDPYRHLITTSFGGDGEGAGDRSIFALPGIDYAQSHRYGDADMAEGTIRAQARLGSLGKPHFVGEVGADASGDRRKDDPKGFQIHDPLWASLASGAAGGAMPWWWDSYIHPNGLYPLFGAVARFTKGIAFDREGFRAVTPRIEYVVQPAEGVRMDAVPTADGTGWSPAPYYRTQTVFVDRSGMRAPRLANLLQGTGNHPELHNPVSFETDLPWPTRLLLEVGDVSGYGGAALKVVRDGETVVERAFVDGDGERNTATLKQYAEAIAVEIPAGRHRTTVENPGQDWVSVRYRLENAVPRTSPPLVASATVGKRTAMVWVRGEDRSWAGEVRGAPRATTTKTWMIVPGLAPGRWKVEFWDTWLGKAIARTEVTASVGGAKVTLPPIASDIALKLTRR